MLPTLLIAAAAAAPRTPNVVLVYADDLGYREIGAFGQKKIPTPTLDRLAAQGLRMDRYYTASPVCAPSRASLLTGLHAGHSPIRGNKEVGGWELNSGEGQFPLPDKSATLAEGFKSAGYATGAFGKWGLGGPGTEGHPNRQGFDQFFGYLCQRQAHNNYPAYLWQNEQVYLLTGNKYFSANQKLKPEDATDSAFEQFKGKQYAEDEIRAKALDFIGQNKAKPFFLYYASTLPHTALQAPDDMVDRFPKEWDPKPYLGENSYLPNKRPRATYAAMIAKLDESVGAIMDKLQKEGIAQDTLIVFTSDNGTTFLGQVDRKFFNSLGELRGTKSTCYEGGIRMPFLASWPGHIPAGSSSGQVGYACDLMPTFAQIAGFKSPKNDGTSLFDAWTSGKAIPRKEIYFEFPEGEAYQAAIFDGRWKAILPGLAKGKTAIEIYDLDTDPGETKDLAAMRPDLVQRARAFFKRAHTPNRDFPLPGVDEPAPPPTATKR